MLLPESDISCESSKVLKEYFFGVHDPGLIFEILRTKIYKEPISAIVREISCNSRDAHREVAQTKNDPSLALVPIEIILPNLFSPYIKFKDYGPGISPDRIEHVFCNYGASTKRDDNIQTGGYGLGCKTPFSYSDTFSIIAVVDGIKRVYNAVIDETRAGKTILNSEQPTDDPDGTTIVIPVKKEDNNKFIEAVLKTTQYWDVRPKLSGLTPAPEYEDETHVLEGDGWYISAGKTDVYGYATNRKPLALIDGIQYDLDIDSIYEYNERHAGYDGSYDNTHTLLESGVRIKFNIGELNLSASRDNIHFDAKTKKIIKDRIKNIFKDIESNLETKISSCKTYSEACYLSMQIIQELPSSIRRSNKLKLSWKDDEIRTGLHSQWINSESLVSVYERKTCVKEGFFTFSNPNKKTNLSLAWPGSYVKGDSKIFLLDYSEQDETDSAPRMSRILVQHLFDTNPNLNTIQIICIPPSGKGKSNNDLLKLLNLDNWLDIKITKEEKAEVRKKSFNSLKKPGSGVEKDPDKVNGYTFQFGRRGGVDLDTPSEQYDIDGEGVYLVLESPKYCGKVIKSNNKEIDKYLYANIISFLGCNSRSVVVFSPQNVKKLGDGWVSLYDAAKEKAEKSIKDMGDDKLNEAINKVEEYLASQALPLLSHMYIKISKQDLLDNTPILKEDCLIKYLDISDEYDSAKYNFDMINNLKGFLDIKFKTSSNKKSDVEKLYNECIKKYPLLFVMDGYNLSYHNKTNIQAKQLIYNYVELANK